MVLDGGEIVERGTHQELLQNGGLYRQIYDLQLRDQEAFREKMDALQEAEDEQSVTMPKAGGLEG